VCICYDGIEVRVSVNGRSIYLSKEISGEFLPCNSPLIIGFVPPENDSFVGIMRDLRIWRIALTENEMRYSMGSPFIEATPDLIGWWPLNRIHQDAADLGLHHNHGTVFGALWI